MEITRNNLLIVDDESVNLALFREVLQDDYNLAFANNGTKAIEIANKTNPNLVLLDIMMPQMDGYETCIQLKQDPKLKDIPVIFVTAKGQVDDEDKGFEVGAVDYITKPVQPRLLKARIRNHLELKNARDELIKQNEILLENMRLREDIERITQHDLKSPLNGIINLPGLILQGKNLSETQREHLERIVQLGFKMLNMINLSLDLYKMEKGTYTFVPLRLNVMEILKDILKENTVLFQIKDLAITIRINGKASYPQTEFFAQGEFLLFYSMLSNIIKNAAEASPENERITIDLNDGDDIKISVHNKGAIPEQVRNCFFDKYTTAGKEGGTGLGTYSARLAAETQKGTIAFITSEETGTTVIMTFPPVTATQ